VCDVLIVLFLIIKPVRLIYQQVVWSEPGGIESNQISKSVKGCMLMVGQKAHLAQQMGIVLEIHKLYCLF